MDLRGIVNHIHDTIYVAVKEYSLLPKCGVNIVRLSNSVYTKHWPLQIKKNPRYFIQYLCNTTLYDITCIYNSEKKKNRNAILVPSRIACILQIWIVGYRLLRIVKDGEHNMQPLDELL